MEAHQILRGDKRKRGDSTTSGVDADAKARSKRTKLQHGGHSLGRDSSSSDGPRREQDGDRRAKADNSRPVGNPGSLTERKGTDRNAQDCSDTEEGQDYLSRFPALIQDKVIGFLRLDDKVRAALVCSAWRRIVYRPCHWHNEKICLDLNHLSDPQVLSLRKREIGHVEIFGAHWSTMSFFLQLFPSVHTMHLASKTVTRVFFQTFPWYRLSSLKEMTLVVFNRPGGYVGFLRWLWKLSNIRKLSVHGRVRSDLMEAIGRELKTLEELSVSCVRGWPAEFSIQGLGRMTNLKSLSLRHVAVKGFPDFCRQNASLTRLRMSHCSLRPGNWLEDLSQLTSLEEIVLEHCLPRTDGGLEQLKQSLVNLKRLTCT